VNLLLAIFIVVLLGAVVFVVSAPLRAAGRPRQDVRDAPSTSAQQNRSHVDAVVERDELVAARVAKYREIRDTEMDYRTGKLSREDYEAIDSELRTEAVEILDRLDRLADLGEPEDPAADDASRRT
jgi:hypothetical protein